MAGAILKGQADQATLMNAVSLLMSVLHRRFQQKVIVLIDEYDAPIHAGYQYGYYDEIVLFMRNLLGAACIRYCALNFRINSALRRSRLRNLPQISRWYNGYLFGDAVIYNPWSVLNFLDSQDRRFRPYWINTSSNDLIQELIFLSSPELHTQLERLLAGDPARCALDENIALRDIRDTSETVMNLLAFSGYLTPVRAWLARQNGSQRLAQLLWALMA